MVLPHKKKKKTLDRPRRRRIPAASAPCRDPARPRPPGAGWRPAHPHTSMDVGDLLKHVESLALLLPLLMTPVVGLHQWPHQLLGETCWFQLGDVIFGCWVVNHEALHMGPIHSNAYDHGSSPSHHNSEWLVSSQLNNK